MTTEVFYCGPAATAMSKRQQATYEAALAYLSLSNKLGAAFGVDAVLGGLITAYVQAVHDNGEHEAAIDCLETAIKSLRHPETIRFEVEGRA